jgi:hypothetical protein
MSERCLILIIVGDGIATEETLGNETAGYIINAQAWVKLLQARGIPASDILLFSKDLFIPTLLEMKLELSFQLGPQDHPILHPIDMKFWTNYSDDRHILFHLQCQHPTKQYNHITLIY